MRLLGNYWAIEGAAFAKFTEQLRERAAPLPREGPAEDAADDYLPIDVEGSIAIIHLAGVVIKDFGWDAAYYGVADTRQVLRAVQAAAADPAIETIVLRIDSPGGSVDGLAELGDAVFAARQVKPVIASVDGLCASAAYYVASQASEVRAGRADLVGCIGTYLAIYDWSKYFQEAGIQAMVFKTGEYKAAGLMGTEITDAQQADFQRIVDEYFADFKAAVQRGRKLSDEAFAAAADGRCWMAAVAMGMGLIDRIANTDDTIVELKSQAAERAAGRTRMLRARTTMLTK